MYKLPHEAPAIGVSLGGTTNTCAAVSLEGKVFEQVQFPSNRELGYQPTLRKLHVIIRALISKYDAVAIGVAVGAPFDPKEGVIQRSASLINWEGINVFDKFAKVAGERHIFPLNDAKAGCLGEGIYGNAKESSSYVFLTFGTGLGAGIVDQGRLLEGAKSCSGEIGHMRIPVHEGFDEINTMEGVCCGLGIQRVYQIAKRLYPNLPTTLGDDPSSKEIFSALKEGDLLAAEVVKVVAETLGVGVANIATIFNPERIVIGGIYTRQSQALKPAIRDALQSLSKNNALAASSVEVVPAMLGENTSAIQAIAIIHYRLANNSIGGLLRI